MKSIALPRGVHSAVWTPSRSTGTLHSAGLRALTSRLVRAGVQGFLVLGTTGEFPLLKRSERLKAIEDVVRGANGLPVTVNVSDVRPDRVLRLAAAASSAGATAVAIMPPLFFPHSQADILEYLLAVASKTDLPIVLYNFPERCGNNLEGETIAQFVRRRPIAGFKQSGGRWEFLRELVLLGKKQGFPVFTGTDTRLAEALELGAAGCVSGLSNFAAELIVGVQSAVDQGNKAAASRFSLRLQEIGRLCDQLSYPFCVAAGLSARGIDPGPPRQIYSPKSFSACRLLEKQLRTKFRQWGLPLQEH
ncbi:MAG: dihydrodipicolinate synthase family protein [Pedosphaera sp.]|nr:dihydrodipicolinate synthase family protein [Pedosphaera sp.]